MKKKHFQLNETKIYGVNICHAIFKRRPGDIAKVYLTQERLKLFAELVRWCVQNKRGYNVVGVQDLERLTESKHHEGICLVVKEKGSVSFEELIGLMGRIGPIGQRSEKEKPCCLLYLDGVQNPHNVGNILRVCSHFGVRFVLTDDPGFETLPASARRVSEGGAETVSVIYLRQPAQGLQRLKKMGFVIYGTSSHCSRSLFAEKISPRAVFVMGAEIEGMSSAIQKICDVNLLIPGTGAVESLNVASACAIFLAKYFSVEV